MPDPTARLRRQARRFLNTSSPTATRYSASFRQEVVDHALARLAEGASIGRIARDLSLRPKSLQVWLRSKGRPSLRRVRVVDPPPAIESRLVVVTPAGIRVEGLDLGSAARLLRLLS